MTKNSKYQFQIIWQFFSKHMKLQDQYFDSSKFEKKTPLILEKVIWKRGIMNFMWLKLFLLNEKYNYLISRHHKICHRKLKYHS